MGTRITSLKVDVDLVAATNVSVIEFYYGNAVIDDGGFRNQLLLKSTVIEYVDASGHDQAGQGNALRHQADGCF